MAQPAAKDAKAARPIIIKRVKKVAGGHHGGAWKVAYADFVTAMMAFFLVMWLVASVSKEQRAAMFDYFKNPSMEQGKSVKPAPGQQGPGGASTAVINMMGGMDAPMSAPKEAVLQATPPPPPKLDSIEEAKKLAAAAEQAQLEKLADQLREAMENNLKLKAFKDQLLIDITPEGLRIQIVDAQNRPMFDLGGSQLKIYTQEILRELVGYFNTVPNKLSLTGHTDTTPYSARNGYSNWDLSADRANAARRALEGSGLDSAKVARVVGMSSSVLFDKEQPRNPINRRISLILMTKQAEENALKSDQPANPADVTADPAATALAIDEALEAAKFKTARPGDTTAAATP
jgi:chemotaxis protein MotB